MVAKVKSPENSPSFRAGEQTMLLKFGIPQSAELIKTSRAALFRLFGPAVATGAAATLWLLILANVGPTLDRWRLTGEHRMAPKLEIRQYPQDFQKI